MLVLKDQLLRTLTFSSVPKRIISLVPSQTELLVDLGLKDYIVGITKFCIHPNDLRKTKTIVGGTKQVNFQKIKDLKPDIIFCNKEENTKQMVSDLEKITLVHVSDISTIDETLELIDQYGKIFEIPDKANSIIQNISFLASDFKNYINEKSLRRVAYFIWKKPWMVAGNNTIINHLLQLNKLENVFGKVDRYPEVDIKDLETKNLDYIFLSSEPYPFKEKHIKEFNNILPKITIKIVNGEYFSWYGTRLIEAFNYFKDLREKLN